MNIAYVVPEFVTEMKGGGLATYINNIAHILANKGHVITIIVKSEKNGSFEYDEKIFIERVNVDLSNVDINLPGSIYRACSKKLNERLLYVHNNVRRIDVVQYANWSALGYYRTDIPTVVRISSDWPYWRAANRLDYSKDALYECEKVTDYLEEIALMNADKVFGPSDLFAGIISKRTGVDIDVIESPFENKHITMDESVYEEKLCNRKYIFTYGSLNLLKGIKLIGDSIYRILKENKDCLYAFAGNDWGWQDECGKKVSAINYVKEHAREFADRVIYLGALSREQLHPIISKAEMCVFPSRVDNLPNACIEAMAMGKIVIGTLNASFEQLIDNEENGFLIEKENVESLCSTIFAVNRLPDCEKECISASAKKRIEKIDSSKIGDETIELFNKVLKGKKIKANKEYYNLIQGKYKQLFAGFGDEIEV